MSLSNVLVKLGVVDEKSVNAEDVLYSQMVASIRGS